MTNYFNFAFDKSDKHNLKFESASFWAPLIHCVPKNTEKETRWSLNFRFKNMFSPMELRVIDYFKTTNLSSITKLALEKKRKIFSMKIVKNYQAWLDISLGKVITQPMQRILLNDFVKKLEEKSF